MGLVRDPIADLRRRLGRRSRPHGRVRAIVRAWWSEQGFDEHPTAVGKRVALALLERPTAQDKLAGILVLHDLLGEALRAADLTAFARLYAAGHLADTVVNDAFATRVIGRLLSREVGRAEVLRTLTGWRDAASCDQRRAACIALATLAPLGDSQPGVTDAILLVCATVVWSIAADDQTAVGAVLRELSRAEPLCVEAFFRRYARLMSRACARTAIAKLSSPVRAELLAHHRRATTLRR
jgi:hypothetical protein